MSVFDQAADDILASDLARDASIATDEEGPYNCRILLESDKSEARNEGDSELAGIVGVVTAEEIVIAFKTDVLTVVPVVDQDFYLDDVRYRIVAREVNEPFLELVLKREES